VNPHAVPSQVAVALAGGAHAVHDVGAALAGAAVQDAGAAAQMSARVAGESHTRALQWMLRWPARHAMHDVVRSYRRCCFDWHVPEQS